jgi:hypothetical protein
VPVNLITWGPSVECQTIFVLLTTDRVGGVKAVFDTSMVWVSTGGLGPVLLPPQAASATTTKGNTRRTRMSMSSERVRTARLQMTAFQRAKYYRRLGEPSPSAKQ